MAVISFDTVDDAAHIAQTIWGYGDTGTWRQCVGAANAWDRWTIGIRLSASSGNLPAGATVSAAALTVNGRDGLVDMVGVIYLEDAASPVANSSSNHPEARTKTSASVNWTATLSSAAQTSPDFATALQEVVDNQATDITTVYVIIAGRSNGSTVRADLEVGTAQIDVTYTAGSSTDALTSTNITAGNPAIGTPGITQIHDLTGANVTSGPAVVNSADIGQVHGLSADSVTAGNPAIGTPAAAQSHGLTATGITTSDPAIAQPDISQQHALTADTITSSDPVIAAPTITQAQALTVTAIATGNPVIGTPTIGTDNTDVLTSTSITAGNPVIASPTINQIHALAILAIVAGAPVVGTSTIGSFTINGRLAIVRAENRTVIV